MAPVGLEHLPPEILYLILGHLGVCTRQRPLSEPLFCLSDSLQKRNQPAWYSVERHLLRTLCLVSRQWRQLVEPILYQEFMPGYGDSWRSDRYTWDRRLTAFMRTVAHRRDLAARVRRIYIHPYLLDGLSPEEPYGGWGCVKARQRPRPITRQEAQDTLREIAQALGDDELRTLSAGDLLAGLMAELPHLEHLSLQIGPHVHRMLGSAGLRAARISLQPLKTIDICFRPTDAQVKNGTLLHLDECVSDLWAVCPALETLNLHMCGSLWRRPAPFPSLPKLTTLRLTHSHLSKRDLENVLSACPGLRHFCYESTRRSFTYTNPYDCGEAVQLEDAVKSLERHRATLESVHLDGRREVVFGGGSELGPVISFQAFPVLHHVFLNVDEIHHRLGGRVPADDPELWVQMLPPNIRSLHLACTVLDERRPREESLVRGLAHAVSRGQCPSLREVKWGGRTRNRGKKLSDGSVVSAMFAAAGVDFGDAVWPGSPATPSVASNVDLGFYNYAPDEGCRMPLPDEDDPDL